MHLRTGEIYWIDDFPPLDGTHSSRRPVVVIDVEGGDPVIVTGITTDPNDPDRVDIANTKDEPGTTTGLTERSCAIPRWTLQIDRSRIKAHEYAGYLPQVTLAKLVAAVDAVMSEYPPRRDASKGEASASG